MIEELVLDTSIFIVSLVDESKLDPEGKKQSPLAMPYINGLEQGNYLIHLPRIAIVEIAGVIRRKAGAGLAAAVKNRLAQWVSLGLIRLYDLEETRMSSAIDVVIQHNVSRRRSLSAPDAIFISLAEELGIRVVTFDKYFEKVSSRALVPV